MTTTARSTQVFQVIMSMIRAGLIDADDLKNANLVKVIETEISEQKLKPSATTGLFTSGQLDGFIKAELPHWQRILTINAGGSAREIAITNDVSNVGELNVFANEVGGFGVGVDTSLRPAGAPCGISVPVHVPGTKPTPIADACASIFGTFNGSLTFPVYGNSLLIGASNGSAPYTGISQIVAKRAPGSHPTVNLAALKATNISINTSDPFDFSFGTPPDLQVTGGSSGRLAVMADYYALFNYNNTHPMEFTEPTSLSSAGFTVNVNGWNPFNLPRGDFSFCTTWNVCQSLNSSATFDVTPPFADPGTDLAYFNWQGTNGTTIGTVVNCKGYVIHPSANEITITSTKPTVLVAKQPLGLAFLQTKGCGAVSPAGSVYPPAGTVIEVEAVGTNGITYTGQAIQSPPLTGLKLSMDSFLPIVTITSLKISMKFPAAFTSPIQLQTVASQYTP